MAICKTCGAYYKKSAFNNSEECELCKDVIDEDQASFEQAYEADLIQIKNPSGRTLPVFQEEGYDSLE